MVSNCTLVKALVSPAVHLTDADFADDLALISNSIEQAQKLLSSLESAANCVGLYLNDSKTEYMHYP